LKRIATDVAERHALDGLSIRNIILAADTSLPKSASGNIEFDNFIESIGALYS